MKTFLNTGLALRRRNPLVLSACALALAGTMARAEKITGAMPAPGPFSADQGNGTYLNPILPGDYADPSIVRVGDDYYLVNSCFEYSPGLLIWHSKDLVNWKPICRAATAYDGEILAPDISFREGKYWIYYCTVYYSETGAKTACNRVITAPSPAGPWTAPVGFEVKGIDPSRVEGPDGKPYLHTSGGRMIELTPDGLGVTGEVRVVVEPWPIPIDWPVEGVYLEGAKFFQHGGWYHLLLAEGGTAGPATSHMVISARSKTPWGPWEYSPYNPVIHTKSREEIWWSTGHGSLIDTPERELWMVLHGYRKDYYSLGRQTLLLPMEWTDDGWFRMKAGIDPAKPIQKPKGGSVVGRGMPLSDSFDFHALGLQWSGWKNGVLDRLSVGDGKLSMTASGTDIRSSAPLTVIPCHKSYAVEVDVEIPDAGTSAGLTLFYNTKACVSLFLQNGSVIARRYGGSDGQLFGGQAHVRASGNRVRLRIENRNHEVGYSWAEPGQDWQRLRPWEELSGYNHNTYGGFISLRAGVFSAGTKGKAFFRNFVYRPLD